MLKESINRYSSMQSTYETGLLRSRATEGQLLVTDWEAVIKTVLAPGPYLQTKTW